MLLFALNTINRGFVEKTTSTRSPHICEQIWHMSTIKDYVKIMEGLDIWNEASGFIRSEDAERRNADEQITIKTCPVLLKMSVTSPTVRNMLFVDNLFLIGACC